MHSSNGNSSIGQSKHLEATDRTDVDVTATTTTTSVTEGGLRTDDTDSGKPKFPETIGCYVHASDIKLGYSGIWLSKLMASVTSRVSRDLSNLSVRP